MEIAVRIAVGVFLVIALAFGWGTYMAVSRDFIACDMLDLRH